MLTIHVHLPGGRATLIRDVRLAEPALIAKRNSGILRHHHHRAPHQSDIMDLLPGIEETITAPAGSQTSASTPRSPCSGC